MPLFPPSAGLTGNCYKKLASKISASLLLENFLRELSLTSEQQREERFAPRLWANRAEERRRRGACQCSSERQGRRSTEPGQG